MVARDAQRVSRSDHTHDQAKHLGCLRPAVDQVSEEDRPPPVWRPDGAAHSVVRRGDRVAEPLKDRDELVGATVHVADDVEGTSLVLQVVPQARPLDRGRSYLLGGGEHEDVPETLALQALARAPELPHLPRHHMRTEVPVRAVSVAFVTDL